MPDRLAGKVAIVTGAARGQGLETARLFASEGARVAALDRHRDGLSDLESEFGSQVAGVVCDVSDGQSVREAVEGVVDRYGAINILYNNAGVAIRRPGPWDESQDGGTVDVTEDVFDAVIGINLKSQFLMCKYAIPHMIDAGGGSIVNVASVGGVFVGSGIHAYCASKGGIMGLSLALAFTYGPQGIRTNVLCPGLIDTPMVEEFLDDPESFGDYSTSNPLRRVGLPSEMAAAGLFLASDDSSYVNGAVMAADGGSVVRSV